MGRLWGAGVAALSAGPPGTAAAAQPVGGKAHDRFEPTTVR